MGSPIAFESRRKELEQIWNEKYPHIPPKVTNSEITKSFIDLIETNNSNENDKYDNIGLSEPTGMFDDDEIDVASKSSNRSIDFCVNPKLNSGTVMSSPVLSNKLLSVSAIAAAGQTWDNDNYLLQYLKCCSIGVIIGDVLFIHGGLHSYNLG